MTGHATTTFQPLTLHHRIREELRARILAGTWQPHDQLPSESELMAQYRVSRITVRHALGDLAHERLIFRVAGKGSFVAQPRPFQPLGRLQGFAEAMEALGHVASNRVLSVTSLAASDEVAQRLQLPPQAAVLQIRRVRLLDQRPVSVDTTWLPAEVGQRVAREDLVSRDIFHILEHECGLPLGYADLGLDAGVADDATAALLQLPAGAPVLHIERLTHTRDGLPIDHEHLVYRADFQVRLRLHREPQQSTA